MNGIIHSCFTADPIVHLLLLKRSMTQHLMLQKTQFVWRSRKDVFQDENPNYDRLINRGTTFKLTFRPLGRFKTYSNPLLLLKRWGKHFERLCFDQVLSSFLSKVLIGEFLMDGNVAASATPKSFVVVVVVDITKVHHLHWNKHSHQWTKLIMFRVVICT